MVDVITSFIFKKFKYLDEWTYMIPTDPAVKPTARKKTNSNRSLGKEFTIKLMWVIWPCAPQV